MLLLYQSDEMSELFLNVGVKSHENEWENSYQH